MTYDELVEAITEENLKRRCILCGAEPGEKCKTRGRRPMTKVHAVRTRTGPTRIGLTLAE